MGLNYGYTVSYLPQKFPRPPAEMSTTYYLLPTYLPACPAASGRKNLPDYCTYLPPLFCGLELGSPRKNETLLAV